MHDKIFKFMSLSRSKDGSGSQKKLAGDIYEYSKTPKIDTGLKKEITDFINFIL